MARISRTAKPATSESLDGQSEPATEITVAEPTTQQILGARLYRLATKVVQACLDSTGVEFDLKATTIQPVVTATIERPGYDGSSVSLTHDGIYPRQDGISWDRQVKVRFAGLADKKDKEGRVLCVDESGEFKSTGSSDTFKVGSLDKLSEGALSLAAVLCAYLEDFGRPPDYLEPGMSCSAPHNNWQTNVAVSFPTGSKGTSLL